jgi:hypothetical protein
VVQSSKARLPHPLDWVLVAPEGLAPGKSIPPPASSAEHVTWICNAASQRLSRLLGAQSLPLADGAVGCTFSYLDGAGAPLVPPATGLDAATRARIALVALDLRLRPRGGGNVHRSVAVALRGPS